MLKGISGACACQAKRSVLENALEQALAPRQDMLGEPPQAVGVPAPVPCARLALPCLGVTSAVSCQNKPGAMTWLL